jgi:ring-1,2-phenylacetyl-CoA epoxidase subunit PaaE
MAFSFFKKTKVQGSTGTNYHLLTVKEVIKETADAVQVVFEQPEKTLKYKSGQFLTLIFSLDGKEVRRAYSLCSSPESGENPAIAVKRVNQGLVSNHVVSNLKAGDQVQVMDPAGHFTLDLQPSAVKHYMLFSGGSGITPMLSLIKSILSIEKASYCTLIYCNRDEHSIIFKDKLSAIQTENPDHFRIFHILEQPAGQLKSFTGLINQDNLNQIFSALPAVPSGDVTYMMCGPEGLMNKVTELLTARGIPADSIRHESFTAPSVKSNQTNIPAPGASTAHDVRIRYDGQEFTVRVEAGATILSTALALGIDLPYSCQSGLCTACRGKALSGKVKLDEEDGLSAAEREEGYILTCVGHPLTDDVVIEIG